MKTAKQDSQLIVCGGCNAKMGPADLDILLKDLPNNQDPNLIVGYESTDDAAVYQLDDHTAVIQTIDFFPSMVSDPYLFGQIAATNALSDVFAMGGDVLLALNIVCYPEKGDRSILEKILKGGQEKIVEAGGTLAGGHSIHDRLPKYGLSVTGKIDPNKIIKNDTVRNGDVLILTKSLGVGIVSSAYGAHAASEEAFEEAVKSMTMLNKDASEIMRKYNVSGCTDVTGFGLAGHLSEMLSGNDHYCAVINSESLPIIPEAYSGAGDFMITAGGQRNRKFVEKHIKFTFDDYALEEVIFDPQTSGGLLMSVSKEDVKKVEAEMAKKFVPFKEIGFIQEKKPSDPVRIIVR